MLAVAVLPIMHDTLKYGSNDGGITVKADHPDLNKKMEVSGGLCMYACACACACACSCSCSCACACHPDNQLQVGEMRFWARVALCGF